MLVAGGITFGLIIGYLAWHAVRPGEPGTIVTLKTIGAFVGVVAGATITALFPDEDMLAAYFVGLAIGFFFIPIHRWLSKSFQSYKAHLNHSQMQRKRKFEDEIKQIESEWPDIERIVQHKLENNTFGITVDELTEFPFTNDGRFYIMQRFARQHADEGYEITTNFGTERRLRRNPMARFGKF